MRHLRALVAAGLAGLATGIASGGPDVIVGDLPDVENYTTSGPVSGMRAYAVGTTSCNIGDTPLTWIDCSNSNDPQCRNHPVISQNMYRIIDGRFEQIGQAWLKHGFCALQGTVCGACTPGGNCDALFPGCSDPYSAGLNGSQGGLGPKSEVNPATGYFPYPFINQGSGDATLRKRLLVADTDIDVAGAIYFVSSMYIQPEDAAFGNDNNNQSYRRITFSAAPARNLLLQDSTQRIKPAVFAWRDHGLGVGQPDPNVILTSVDVPGDGRFWVAAKARDLGAGQWRYSYAVQNLTSERAGQAFSVPIPAGANVTNINFRDVDYHSGEPYTNTNWTSTLAGNVLTWQGQTFAQNANANALRWDTVYTFWFDCNIPPAGGNATLSLFKSGSPGSMTAATVIPSPDGQLHPFNDACLLATQVGVGQTPFNTTNATTDGPTECLESGYNQIGADIWFTFTAVCDGSHTIHTCGSTFDTKIAVYAGSTCPTSAGTALACNDDAAAGSACSGTLQSSVTFSATQGSTYLIRVGGYASGANPPAMGAGTLTVNSPNCGPVPPSNDNCANADWVAAGTPVASSTSLATLDGTATCGASSGTPDVWFRYRPASSASVTVTTCNASIPGGTTNYDTVLSLHSACGGTQLACNDDASGCGLQSRITYSMTANTTYWIRVSGYSGSTGNFSLLVTGGGGVIPPTPPANDDCANRIGVGLGTHNFTTVAATTDGPAHAACNYFGNNQITNDIWFNYPSLCTGVLTVTTCNIGGFDTKIAVYDGAGCTDLDSRLMSCVDDTAGCGTTTTVTVNVVSGQNYTIRLGGFNGATGSGQWTLSCVPGSSCPPCVADFNDSGGTPDDADVTAFFEAWNNGDECADSNGSGGTPDDADVTEFFTLWNNGGC